MSVYADLPEAYRIIAFIAEVLLREAKATGLSKGAALDARLLHELRIACQELDAAITLPRKKRQGASLARCSSTCLDHCIRVLEAVRRDHPQYLECVFMSPGEPSIPADPELLVEAIILGVSTESILFKKTGRSQPVINRILHQLEKGCFLERIDVTHCARPGSREKLIVADGEGAKWCQTNRIPFKLYHYDYKEGGHVHHLVTNYFAYTTKEFEVVFTYYGFRHKFFPIFSHYRDKDKEKDRSRIEPDLRGFWTDLYSEKVYLPVEIETTYKPDLVKKKVYKYQCSKETRVLLVTNNDDLTQAYRRLLERLTPIRSKYSSPTSFDLFTIVPLSLKKKEKWSTLKSASSVVVG